MVKLFFNQNDIKYSLIEGRRLKGLNNSITKGRGSAAGVLGEVALARYLKTQRPEQFSFDYDLLYNGKKIEVKTKRRTADPKPCYEVSVAKTSDHQRHDVFAFLSLTFEKQQGKRYRKLKAIWLCGFYHREQYYRDARVIRKGEADGNNGFVAHCDTYNMEIGKLLKSI